MKTMLYISDVNNAEPIFHSQVIPHTRELSKYFDIRLMVLSRETKFAGDLVFNYHSVRGDYFYTLAKTNFLRQRSQLSPFINDNKFDLIYSRGTRGGLLGSIIKKYYYKNKIPLLNDVRADVLDEHKNNLLIKSIFHRSNNFVYSNADLLFLVSNPLKNKICRLYKFNTNRAFVFPTFVPDGKFDFNENNRVLKRKELGFSDTDIVVLYSGNLAAWQNVDAILSSFSNCANSHVKLLVLTKDENIFHVVKSHNISNDRVKIRNVKYEEIEQYYHAADFGILIRDNTGTNISAAPTKFSEYVNAGLSVIINDLDADYVQSFKEKQLEGFLLDKKEDLIACFNNIKLACLRRNIVKINNLSAMVTRQKEILTNL